MKDKKKTGKIHLLALLFALSLLGENIASFAQEPAQTEGTLESEEAGEDLFIDEGEVTVSSEGNRLEDVQKEEEEQQRLESERQSEEARLAAEALIEDQDLVLEPASEANLTEHLDYLTAQEDPTGSDGELICADYIQSVMEGYGYTVTAQDFHEGFLNENGIDAPGINLIAERGADSQYRTDDIFLITAHYDSKTNPQENDPFSNDKTGVAVLLEVARILSGLETDTDICFVFFSGEEDGFYGSSRFAKFLEEQGYASQVTGAVHVELAGYDSADPYLLQTVDGQANYAGAIVQEAAQKVLGRQGSALSEEDAGGALTAGLEEAQTESRMELGEESESESEIESWTYLSKETGSHAAIASLGIPAVTVFQDVLKEREKEPLEVTVGSETEEESESDTAGETNGSTEEYEEESETGIEPEQEEDFLPDVRKLKNLADILAAAIGKLMREG